jgi:solute carrier family 13 (sodium-dependent dicarboxylate transporter), member 2/3/5
MHSSVLPRLLAPGLSILASAMVYALGPDEPKLRMGLALFTLIGSLWMTQAFALSITALLVPLLAVLTGVLTVRESLASFANPVIFLFLGGFALAAALSKHGLDRALALAMLRLARGHALGAALLIFGLTAVLSMWLSNTATAAMMLPLALGLLRDMTQPNDPQAWRTQAFVLLGLAYSASIGGIGTLVGSPPNAIAAAQAGISFAQWMQIGLPMAAVMLPLMLVLLYAVLRPQLVRTAPAQIAAEPTLRFAWTQPRLLTTLIFALTVLGWVFGAPLGRWLGINSDMDTMVALTAIALLGITGVLHWQDIEQQTQWGVLLLFGGGLALSHVMAATGASLFLAQSLVQGLGNAPPWLLLLALVTFVVLLTELVSNTASAALLIPIVLGLAPALGYSGASLATAVALSASCAFMLPVATPPNAIVFGSGWVSQRTMMRCGLAINIMAIALITLAVLAWA